MAKAGRKYFISKQPPTRIRKLSPAEFQVFVAIKELGAPTVRQVRDFLAELPPLSLAVDRSPETLEHDSRQAPTYNNINTLLLRMRAVGAIRFLDLEDGSERRLLMEWDFNDTLEYCVRLAVRDYLSYKPVIRRIAPVLLDVMFAPHDASERRQMQLFLEDELKKVAARAIAEAEAADAPSADISKRSRAVRPPGAPGKRGRRKAAPSDPASSNGAGSDTSKATRRARKPAPAAPEPSEASPAPTPDSAVAMPTPLSSATPLTQSASQPDAAPAAEDRPASEPSQSSESNTPDGLRPSASASPSLPSTE